MSDKKNIRLPKCPPAKKNDDNSQIIASLRFDDFRNYKTKTSIDSNETKDDNLNSSVEENDDFELGL